KVNQFPAASWSAFAPTRRLLGAESAEIPDSAARLSQKTLRSPALILSYRHTAASTGRQDVALSLPVRLGSIPARGASASWPASVQEPAAPWHVPAWSI